MNMTILFFLIALIVICAGGLLYLKSNEKNDSEPITWTPPKADVPDYPVNPRPPISVEPSGASIHVGPEFNPKEPVEPEHFVSQLYAERKKDYIWICPYCEVENSQSRTICSVCCQER